MGTGDRAGDNRTGGGMPGVSPEAWYLLSRLRRWQIFGFGRRTFSRRDIHQRIRGNNRQRWRYVASVDRPLTELVEHGLLRQLDPPRPLGRGRPPGPAFELVPPQPSPPRRKRRPKKAEVPAQVEPAQAVSTATSQPVAPQPTMEPEVAWRFAQLWELAQSLGGPTDLPVSPLAMWREEGCCRCCGDPLAPGDSAHCRYCLEAKVLVAMVWKAKRVAGG